MKLFHITAMAGLLAASMMLAAPATAADGFARASGSLRAGPSSDYPVVGDVGAGESLVVHGCVRRYVWCDVSASGERGWFLGRRIAIEREGRRVPLPTVATVIGLSIVGFTLGDYWGAHYRGRPWFEDRRWRHGRGDWRRDHRSPHDRDVPHRFVPMHRDGATAGEPPRRHPPRELVRPRQSEHPSRVRQPTREMRQHTAPRPTRGEAPRSHRTNQGVPRGGGPTPTCQGNCR